MPEQERPEEVSLSLGGDDHPALRCDCGRIFLELNPYQVHRAQCSDYQGDLDETPRRIRERRIIERRGSFDPGGGR